MTGMTLVYLGMGSNVGDRNGVLRKALEHLSNEPWSCVRKVSPFYETMPEGYLPQGFFLNGVAELGTDLPPGCFFRKLQAAEIFFGRKRGTKNGPRTLDLDFLAYGDVILRDTDLTLPHPGLHRRWFVLKPFCDVNPDWMHPVFRRTARTLLEECPNATLKNSIFASGDEDFIKAANNDCERRS